MHVHTNIEDLGTIAKPIVTIGTFDGVHAGHRTIIKRIIALAKEREGKSVLVTFEPHPRFLINPNHRLKLLTTLSEKKELLEALGLDHLIIAPFTQEFAEQEAKDYVEDFLIKKIKPSVLVIGYDHHFGKGRSGSLDLLEEYSKNGHFELEEISKQQVDDAHVSSTAIRNALDKGNVQEASNLLQSNFQLTGTVITGDQKGRTIGFPTANLEIENDKKLIPSNGVYAVQAIVNEQRFKAVMNIGHRPTVNNEKELRLEVHLFNFDKDIYGQKLKVKFIKRIRDEKKFDSFEELKRQIEVDCQRAIEIL
jgi:riboflavin kinase/FMN adenylyltransferase